MQNVVCTTSPRPRFRSRLPWWPHRDYSLVPICEYEDPVSCHWNCSWWKGLALIKVALPKQNSQPWPCLWHDWIDRRWPSSDDVECVVCSLKPVLNWTNVCSPNILRTVRRTMIRFLIELLVRRAGFGQFDELYFVLNWLVTRCKLRPELAADAQQTAWSKM